MSVDRLRLLEARWRLGEIKVEGLHEVADELLTAGDDNPALIRLFSLDPDQLRWEGEEAFATLLRELGGGDMSEAEAAEVISLDISVALLEADSCPTTLFDASTRSSADYLRTRCAAGVEPPR
jgi:hypothetical protein